LSKFLADRWWSVDAIFDKCLETELEDLLDAPMSERMKIEMAMIEKEFYEIDHKLH